jgi:hypothetical protein
MKPYFLSAMLCSFFYAAQAQPKFEAQIVDSNIAIGYGLAIGDVDGDHKPDILLADKKQFVWYRNGDWKRFVMIENLTESDNVCIAARDIDNDGKVEVAVGAQWNPGETLDTAKSGSVHFLVRPKDPTQLWTPVKLYHEPTIHRMRWIKAGKTFQLIVLPLQGKGNKNGEGQPVNVLAYEIPKDLKSRWTYSVIDHSMHLTHNLDIVSINGEESIYIAGKEGIKILRFDKGKWLPQRGNEWYVQGESFGEVRAGNLSKNFVAGIQPMHGNKLIVFNGVGKQGRTVLDSTLQQGHALLTADLLRTGREQVVVGWREPNHEEKTGVKIFSFDLPESKWKYFWIDENGMACEDLQLADLDGDGKLDIIASGRASHNLKIYWNKN